MKSRLLLFLIALAALGCKKNQLKQPTDVSFTIDINRTASSDGKLVFNSGTIALASFDIEGKRQEGDPISFTRNFSEGLTVNFDPNNPISEIQYDIPQGVYTELTISFETFDDNGGSTITVLGTYTNNQGNPIPVIFEFMSSETFEIEGDDSVNSGLIVLDKDTPANAFVQLDPIHWFDILTNNQLENATLTNINGVMTLLINENVNDNLYDIMADRIDESTEAIFN